MILAIIVFSLYLIKRLLASGQTENGQRNETLPASPPDVDDVVTKNRFFLPEQSNSKQRDDRKENSDTQDEKPNIFAAGNDKTDTSAIPPEELDEVFGEDVNPDELDIEPDENETEDDAFGAEDKDDDDAIDADEETEEIHLSAGEIEGYADGFTYDELATVIHDAGSESEKMTQSNVVMLHNLAQTDMFEKIVSSDAGSALRIAYILDRNEQSLVQDKEVSDDSNSEYQNVDIGQFL